MDNREAWLIATMAELAEASGAAPGETGHARLLTARLASLLAPAETALLIADDSGGLRAVAASTSQANDLVTLQARYHEGPCADCHRTGQPVLNEIVAASGSRWPRFAAAARTAGFGIVSALPLRRREQGIGVICIMAPGGRRLTATDARLARVLAMTVVVAIDRERRLRRSVLATEQLQRALDSRVLIEQAKGAVAARLGIAPDEAFELLRAYARQASRKLADVAGEVIGNELPAHDLVVAHEAGRGRPGRGPRVVHSSR